MKIAVNIGVESRTLDFAGEERPTVGQVRQRAAVPAGAAATNPVTQKTLSDNDPAPPEIDFTPAKSKQAI